MLYPLAAAFLAGLVANFRKFAAGFLSSALLGATIAATSALFVFGMFLLSGSRWRRIQICRASAQHFFYAGICTAATDVLDVLVLSQEKVSVISPLLSAGPLFTILLSALFLKSIERVTPTLVAGAVLILLGVEVVILFGR